MMTVSNDRAAAAKVALGTAYEETIEVESDIDQALKGSITYSLPNGKDMMRIAVIQHDLREGRPLEALDALSGGLLVVMSTLAVVVRRAPDWWYRTEGKGRDAVQIAAPELLIDTGIIWDIWRRYVAFCDTFPRRGDHVAAGEPAGGAQPAQVSQAVEPAAV